MHDVDLLGFPSLGVMPWWIIWPYALLFVLIGVWLAYWPPKPNWWGGLRVSWTYADPEIWDKGNRATGWTMTISGVLMAIWVVAGFAAVMILPIAMIPYARHLYKVKYGTGRVWHKEKGWRGYRPVAKCGYCGREVELADAGELATLQCEECGHAFMMMPPPEEFSGPPG